MGLNRYATQLGSYATWPKYEVFQLGDKIIRQGSNIVAIPLGNYATWPEGFAFQLGDEITRPGSYATQFVYKTKFFNR